MYSCCGIKVPDVNGRDIACDGDETAIKRQERFAVGRLADMQRVGEVHSAFNAVQRVGQQRRILHENAR